MRQMHLLRFQSFGTNVKRANEKKLSGISEYISCNIWVFLSGHTCFRILGWPNCQKTRTCTKFHRQLNSYACCQYKHTKLLVLSAESSAVLSCAGGPHAHVKFLVENDVLYRRRTLRYCLLLCKMESKYVK